MTGLGKRPTQATQSTLKARNVVMQFLRDCASFCADIGGVYRLCGRRIDRLPSIRTAAETEN